MAGFPLRFLVSETSHTSFIHPHTCFDCLIDLQEERGTVTPQYVLSTYWMSLRPFHTFCTVHTVHPACTPDSLCFMATSLCFMLCSKAWSKVMWPWGRVRWPLGSRILELLHFHEALDKLLFINTSSSQVASRHASWLQEVFMNSSVSSASWKWSGTIYVTLV